MGGPNAKISPEEGLKTTLKLILEVEGKQFNGTFWEDNEITEF